MALTLIEPAFTDKSWITALGPFKLEVFAVTADGGGDETLTSKLANPRAVAMMVANTDLAGDNDNDDSSATLSGHTITLNDTTDTNSYIVLVFGY